MGLHLDRRPDESYALFIDGDLQFDTRDEALYHEALALPALSLAQPLLPEEGLRVLICGGGDGLALRECLRFPGVTRIDLVDYDPEIVEWGRTLFAEQNQRSFHDSRVNVHLQDAWDFLTDSALYDVILLDFTVPRRPEETRIFTQEWYAALRTALAPDGVMAINGVSPQMTPEGFWCLNKTLRAAGLHPLPYRVCIPSFREQGYGIWGFFLASQRRLSISHLRRMRCPVTTTQTDLSALWRGAQFSREERAIEQRVPTHTLENPCYLPLLLNPGLEPDAALEEARLWRDPYNLDPLLGAIPVSHPYHTREMIETLAGQVAGSVRMLDIPRLVDALLARASRLTDTVLRELQRLRDFLSGHLPPYELFRRWASRLFAILVVLMTLANAIAPDNAFAKGSAGLGRSSISRGYSSSYRSSRSSFGGERGFGSSGRATGSGSVGSGRSATSGSFSRSGSFVRSSSIRSTGFRRSYGRGQATDIYGNAYTSRIYIYCGSGYGHTHYYGGGHASRPADAPPPEQHKVLFVADDDMMVMENGDVIVTLSDSTYLLVNNGTVALFASKQPDPLLALYPDPELFRTIQEQIAEQQAMAREEIAIREDWLSWVGWTKSLFPTVQADRSEVDSLRDLLKRLETAKQRLGTPPAQTAPKTLPPGAVELFAGGFLLPEKKIALRRPDGLWNYTDGKTVWSEKSDEKPIPAPPELADAIKSILTKLDKEMQADLTADDNDLRGLSNDMASLQKDLNEYSALASQYGSSYEVDYGTDEISASEAIARTNQDIADVRKEYGETLLERQKTTRELETIQRGWFGNTGYQATPAPVLPIFDVPNSSAPISYPSFLSR